MKVRRIDYSADEMIAGVIGQMDPLEFGIYWMICTLIYSRGGPIKDDPEWISRVFRKTNPRTVRATMDRLIAGGKIQRNSGELMVNRCRSELERAVNRSRTWSENGAKGGRKTNENKEIIKPRGFTEKNRAFNHQLSTINDHEEQPDSSGPVPPPEPSAAAGKVYSFHGRKLRLTEPDLARWRRAYSAIPDIGAELTSIDDWLATNRPKASWSQAFQAASGMLAKKHQSMIAERKTSAVTAPLPVSKQPAWMRVGNYALWADLVNGWVARPDRGWGDNLGPPPDHPGFIGPPDLAVTAQQIAKIRGAA